MLPELHRQSVSVHAWLTDQQFVVGDAALSWDKDKRCYVAVAGWVPEPNQDPTALPTEPGKAVTAGDAAKPK